MPPGPSAGRFLRRTGWLDSAVLTAASESLAAGHLGLRRTQRCAEYGSEVARSNNGPTRKLALLKKSDVRQVGVNLDVFFRLARFRWPRSLHPVQQPACGALSRAL